MVYQYRTIDYPVSAQKVGEHLEELDREYGEVTPQIMVDDARPEDALMHPMFEWDDSVAAEKYRHNQARKITSELVMIQVSQEEPELNQPQRAFVTVNARNEKASYRPIMVAMADADMKNQVIENAKTELAAYEKKYRGLVDLVPILEEMIERLKK